MSSLKTTWHHVRRSPYQAFAAVLLIMQTFFVVSIFSYIIISSSRIISYFESKPQVVAFFKDDAKQEQIDGLKQQITQTNKIASIKFVSKQEALNIYKEQNKDDPLLLELVTADVLPASLEISTKAIADLTAVSDMLRKSSIVSDVAFQKDVVKTLTSWTSALRKIGMALIVVLAIDSMLIMIIIIGIKISQKRTEIEIMRLIGATSWYVRKPFIYEGIFYGVVGAFFGWLIAAGFLLYSQPFLSAFLRGIPVIAISPLFLLQLLGAEVLLAMLLGVFVSFLAVLRYLK